MELELIMSDVAIRYLGDLIFIANFKIFSRGGGGGGGGWGLALRYRGGRIRSFSKFKNTPIALISGHKNTLILIKTLTFSSK